MLLMLAAVTSHARAEGQIARLQLPVSVDDVSSSDTAAPILDPLDDQAMQELYLEVIDDDRPTGRIVHARLQDGRLLLAADQLRALGITLSDVSAVDPDGWIWLDAVPNLVYRYERFSQRLFLQTPASLRPTSYLGYVRPGAVSVRRDWGALFTYDGYGRSVAGAQSLSMTNTLRWFGPFGAIEATGLGHASNSTATTYRRLDAYWTYSDPQRLWTYTAGDFISAALSWTRPVRLGGVQWRRNFGVRPDLITLPMPQFAGNATLPSSVELYVNNVRQFRADVAPGPFVLDTVPRIRGAGEATMLVTDALGRVTETTLPIFVDHQRLARGLTDFSVEAGLPRLGYGSAEDDYGDSAAASASVRHGLFETLTVEAHAEASDDVRLAGVGTVWTPGSRWGIVSASYARSKERGEQWSAGYQWSSRGYGFDLQRLEQNDAYRDLGSSSNLTSLFLPRLLRQDRATAWLPVPRGSVSFSYLGWRDATDTVQWTRTLSWSQTIGRRLSFSTSLFDDKVTGLGGGVTMTVPMGGRSYGTGSVRHGAGGTTTSIGARRPAPYGGGWGFTARAGDGPGAYSVASGEVRGRFGEAALGMDRAGDRSGLFAQGSGSLAIMDRRVFPTRRITDAFAVVSTNGMADVPVLYENRVFATTGASGYVLIPDLRGWQRNRLGIDPDNLTATSRVGDVQQFATPPDRGGVLVQFDLVRTNPAVVVLLGPDGQPVAAGSRGQIVGTAGVVIVGFEGEAYLEDVSAAPVIEVPIGALTCRYRLPASIASGGPGQPLRLTLSCEVVQP